MYMWALHFYNYCSHIVTSGAQYILLSRPNPPPAVFSATLDDAALGEYTNDYGTPGIYEFLCTAEDDMGNTGTGTVNVEVQKRK